MGSPETDHLSEANTAPAGANGAAVEAAGRLSGGAVLEALFSLQRHAGYLSEAGLREVSTRLGIPLSQVYGVATFYNAFTFAPPGRHRVHVCCGTACHVRGAPRILEKLERELGIKPGGTTPDRAFSLQVVRCLGSCSLAPVVVIDGEVRGRFKVEQVSRLLDGSE
ncbi:MAG: NAD(P)H-dependent oxidoreductase subunit E [Bacillota bacterium]|nr:NAD(P)H-dependent oxidoreductase subunit E [Bacillota bacterium]